MKHGYFRLIGVWGVLAAMLLTAGQGPGRDRQVTGQTAEPTTDRIVASTVREELITPSEMTDADHTKTHITAAAPLKKLPLAEIQDEAHLREETAPASFDEQTRVPVLMEGQVRMMPLSDYLRGVLCAELPRDFHEETFRAQAVAARTYALYCVQRGDTLSTHGVVHMAYRDPDEVTASHRTAADASIRATDGQVLTYEGTLACTVFHAMSSGYTADAVSVWGYPYPYLVSVATQEDRAVPDLYTEVRVPMTAFCDGLGLSSVGDVSVRYGAYGRAEALCVDHTVYDAEMVRSVFGLRSADFSAVLTEEGVCFTVRGYGHGVGMSQWGAEYMARQGCTYVQILQHYYQGAVSDTPAFSVEKHGKNGKTG